MAEGLFDIHSEVQNLCKMLLSLSHNFLTNIA